MFHALCWNTADCLIGSKGADRSNPAWVQTYRAVEHGHAKARCKDNVLSKFPKDIEDFASVFVEAQEQRHRADYDPTVRFTRSEVLTLILKVDEAIRAFRRVSIKDRRAFAALIVLKNNRN